MGSYVPFPVSTALSLSARVSLLRVDARTAEASSAVALLGLHLLVDEPERVDVSRNIAEATLGLGYQANFKKPGKNAHREKDVDEEVAAAASNES
jgi:hypothetical protein